jgi:hypothetical protein
MNQNHPPKHVHVFNPGDMAWITGATLHRMRTAHAQTKEARYPTAEQINEAEGLLYQRGEITTRYNHPTQVVFAIGDKRLMMEDYWLEPAPQVGASRGLLTFHYVSTADDMLVYRHSQDGVVTERRFPSAEVAVLFANAEKLVIKHQQRISPEEQLKADRDAMTLHNVRRSTSNNRLRNYKNGG